MPYYISNNNPNCTNWAVEKEDGEVIGCHNTKQGAIDQMVAVSIAEDMEPGGERNIRAAIEDLEVGMYVRWISGDEVFYGEIYAIDGTRLEVKIYDEEKGVWYETDLLVLVEAEQVEIVENLPTVEPQVEEEDSEDRQVNLTPPAYMRAAARQGIRYYEEGLAGDGLMPATVREARAMAAGNVTAEKWVRIRAWIARHIDNLDSPDADPSSDNYPSPGVVAHLLWGSGPSKRAAQRALDYAAGVVARIEAENEGRAKGQALSKIETRIQTTDFEIRQDETGGMLFEGYAAVFNSASEPLPFTEKIAPGAFRGSLRSRNDIKLLWNHDTGQVLGSTRAGTLSLYEDEKGLRVRAQLPNTTLGRDTAELIRRGDVNAMSFGFSVPKNGDSWNDDGTERTLKAVRLHEVSIVAFPAYTATAGTATVRGLDKIAKRADVDADQLADALLKIESGMTMSLEEKSLITKVLDTLAPEATASQDEFDGEAWLALKKKKLETLIKKA